MLAVIIIGTRFRMRLHRLFVFTPGVECFQKQEEHECCVKRARALANAQGNSKKQVEIEVPQEFVWRDLPFVQRYKVIEPFLVRNRTRYAVSVYARMHVLETDKKAKRHILDYLSYLNSKRQGRLCLKLF